MTLLPFLLVSLIHLGGELAGSLRVRYLSKPLLMPLLALYYLTGAADPSILMILAIGGGWLGDLFLMIPDPGKTRKWFRPGLAAFLLGHIFYMIVFLLASDGIAGLPASGWGLIILFLIFGTAVFIQLKPHMGKLAPAITVYILVITAMGFSTVLCLGSRPLGSALTAVSGAFIFMISDTVNAWNKFARDVPNERVITMSTYLLGQLLLVAGYLGFF